MANLIYSAITSLDGYIEDENDNIDWGVPDEQVHTFINTLERSIGTYLYGRRMYEVMVAWENTDDFVGQPSYIQDYADLWQAADKVVYSKTINDVSSARTQINHEFLPDVINEMKAHVTRDISVGGPELAGHAFRTGLIDECHLILAQVVVGAGKRSLSENLKIRLELLDENRFDNGMIHLHYRIVK